MVIRFLPGFTVMDGEGDICWASPHSGPSLRFSDSRDDRSDLVAHLCWEKLGGRLVISNVSRMRDLGVDLNRAAPDAETAISMFRKYAGNVKEQDACYDYRKKYAWVAADRRDHESRLGVYRAFWTEVGAYNTAVMVHRMFTTPSTAGSVIDLFTRGFDGKAVENTVRKVNTRYAKFLRSIKPDMTRFMQLEEKRNIDFIERTPPDEIETEFVNNIERHKSILGVRKNTEIEEAIGRFMKGISPKITYRNIFSGSKSYGIENPELRGKNIIQAEVTSFLGFWYPDVAAEMLCMVTEELAGV